MKNPDEALERVLQGLREAEAPLGMERRILEAVQMRSVAASRWRFALPSMLIAARPWALVATAVTVVALVASVALHRLQHVEHGVANIKAQRSPHSSGAPDIRPEVAETTRPAHAREILHSRIKSTAAKMEVAKEAISNEDALALSEMNAPSQPAPPMPLTEQEKLLLQVVHRGDPVELAMLDPKMRSSDLAGSKAQFDAFFSPPKRDDSKVAPETKPTSEAKTSANEKPTPNQVKEEKQ